MRDPRGSAAYYNQTWYNNDTRWTNALINQVPFGINPKISQ